MKTISVKKVLVILLCLVSVLAHGFFEDIGRDARARGMANAMVSIYGDVHSIHYNPAGTARTRNLELNLIWGKPLTMTALNDNSSFSDIYVASLMPFTNGFNHSWLIRWLFKGLTLGNEDFMFKNGAMAYSFYQRATSLTDTSVTERMITLNYAKILDDVIFKGAKLAAGFNLDFYMLSFNANADSMANPSITSTSAFSMGLDFGVIYDFAKTIRLGIVFENLLKPNYSFLGGDDKAPSNTKLGGSMFFNKLLFFENLTLTLNYITYGKYDETDNTVTLSSWHYAFESWWFDNHFAFRGGLTLGDDEQSEISTGISFLLPMGEHVISVDYALTIPLGVSGTRHILALTWKWEQPKYAFVYDKKRAAEMKRLADLEKKQNMQGGNDKKKTDTNTDGKDGGKDKKKTDTTKKKK